MKYKLTCVCGTVKEYNLDEKKKYVICDNCGHMVCKVEKMREDLRLEKENAKKRMIARVSDEVGKIIEELDSNRWQKQIQNNYLNSCLNNFNNDNLKMEYLTHEEFWGENDCESSDEYDCGDIELYKQKV